MGQSPWETNWFLASQEIPCILWNLKVHYHVCKCPPPVSALSQLKPFQTPHFLKIHLNIILPSMSGSSMWSLSLRFPYQNPIYTFLCPIHATCPTHLIPLYLITQIIFGEQYRSLSSSFCSFLNSPVTLSLLGPNIFFSTLFAKHPQPIYLPQCEWPNSHLQKTAGKIIVLYIFIFKFLDSKLKTEDSALNNFLTSFFS